MNEPVVSTDPFKGADASKIKFPGEEVKPVTETVKVPPVTETPASTAPVIPSPAKTEPVKTPAATTEPVKTTTEPVKTDPLKTPETPVATTPDTPPAPLELTEEEYVHLLNENTGLEIANLQDVRNIFEENKTLKIALENKELEFPNAQAKEIYNFAIKFAGAEKAAALTYAQAMSIEVDKMEKSDPKRLQFEAFLLSKPHLTRDGARAVFDARYAKQYEEGWENDPVLAFEHEEATREAKLSILKSQEAFNKVEPAGKKADQQPGVDPEVIKEVTTGINSVMKDFDGISISFDDTPEGTLNLDLKPEETVAFQQAVLNPQSFFNDLFESCRDAKGQLDYGQYTSEMYEIIHRKQIIAAAHKHGVARGGIKILEEAKNTTVPGDTIPTGTGTPPPPKETLEGNWAAAYEKSLKK